MEIAYVDDIFHLDCTFYPVSWDWFACCFPIQIDNREFAKIPCPGFLGGVGRRGNNIAAFAFFYTDHRVCACITWNYKLIGMDIEYPFYLVNISLN